MTTTALEFLATFDPRRPWIESEALGVAACSAYALLLGAALKLVDDTWDERLYARRIAVPVFLVGTASFISLVLANVCFATIVVALVVGVLLVGKVDNLPFRLGAAAVLATATVRGLGDLEAVPLVAMASAVALDEVLEDLAESRRAPPTLRRILRIGVLWKASAIGLVVLGGWPLRYAAAILAFEAGYVAMGAFGARRRTSRLETTGRPT